MKIERVDRSILLVGDDCSSPGGEIDEAFVEEADLERCGQSVTIALPSTHCLAFEFAKSDTAAFRKRSLIVYELEDQLPCDGDDLAIGRLRSRDNDLILAAESPPLLPLVQQLDATGIYVRSISPLVMMAIASLQRSEDLSAVDLLCWASEVGIDLIWLSEGKPTRWNWIAKDDPQRVEEAAKELFDHQGYANVFLIGCDIQLDMDDEQVVVSELEHDQFELAAREAQLICDGHASPSIDLRDGPLASSEPYRPIAKPLGFAAFSLVALQVLLIAGIWIVAYKYRRLADQLNRQSIASYLDVFPDSPIPVGVKARLQSEHRRMMGTRGLSERAAPRLGSVVPVAHVFLSAAPEQVTARYRFDRIEFLPGQVALATGTAKSFADQEAVRKGLRIAGLVVPPLSTEARSDGVSLRLENVGLASADSGDDQ